MIGGTHKAAAAISAVLLATTGCEPAPRHDARVPAGYPDTYAETIAAAEQEGVINIWSTTDQDRVKGLLAAFQKRYPRIRVEYSDMQSSEIDERFHADLAKGRPTADLLWSSAMDLQIKLVNDGYARNYVSPEAPSLPHWANWKGQAWGITAEPIVIVYNRKLIAPAPPPTSHLDLRTMLEAGKALDGRVATYDPVRSAVGYLYLSQDDEASRDVWRTVRALGANHVRLHTTSEAIIADVSSGKAVLGYNVVGSYAVDEMQRNPDLAVVLPRDYTLVMSRIAVIPARAPHSHAAQLFLDYLLSQAGQRELAAHSMTSVRSDVPVPASLRQPGVSLRAVRVGPALLVLQDRLTRKHFTRSWEQALAAGASGPVR